jgi:hypothetical protein
VCGGIKFFVGVKRCFLHVLVSFMNENILACMCLDMVMALESGL